MYNVLYWITWPNKKHRGSVTNSISMTFLTG